MRHAGPVLLVAAFCIGTPAWGQEEEKEKAPLADLQKQVESQWGGWAGDKRNLYPLFAAEHKRLGERFEKELMKFVGGDADRHYWIASFLTSDQCLDKKDQRPELALLLLEEGALICRRKMDDQNSRARLLSTLYCATVLSEQMGFKELASHRKAEVVALLKKEPILAGATPAMGEGEHELYESIPLPEGDAVRSIAGESRWSQLTDDARELARAMAADRKRLDDETFRKEVLKLVGDDPANHYELAVTLLGDPALKKGGRLPALALLLLEQSAAICHRDMVNQDTRAQLVSTLYYATVLSAQSGFMELASQHKSECKTMLDQEPILAGAAPAMTDEEHKLYQSIPLPGKK